MSIYQILNTIQKELQVPKENYNRFSDFKYRSCEDILEGIKKVLPDECYVLLSDDVVAIGERHYVKSTASFYYKDQCITAQAFAREPLEKKKFDDSQVTGAASSYARKYALNGLFMIDDAKDADAQEGVDQNKKVVTGLSNNVVKKSHVYFNNPNHPVATNGPMSKKTYDHLRFLFSHMQVTEEDKEKFKSWAKVSSFGQLTESQALSVIKNLEKKDPEAAQAWMELAKVREQADVELAKVNKL